MLLDTLMTAPIFVNVCGTIKATRKAVSAGEMELATVGVWVLTC